MIAFLTAFFAVCLVWATGIVITDRLTTHELWGPSRVWIAFVVSVLPTLGAFLGAAVVGWAFPRKMFVRRGARWQNLALPGAIAGVISIVVEMAGVVYAEQWIPPEVIAGASGIIAAALVVFAGKRYLGAWACVRCGYDLAGSMMSGRCPECGEPIPAG